MGGESFREERKITVLIVDDQVCVSELLSSMLDREKRYAVVAEAKDGFQGLSLFRKYSPALTIVALSLPGLNGAELIRAVREEDSTARVLIFSGTRNRDLLAAGLMAHPQGFVHKTEPLDLLRQAVNLVTQGARFFSPYGAGLADEFQRSALAVGKLTTKERAVLQLIAEGQSSKQAAARLVISPKTVEHYRAQLMRKLNLWDVASLTRYAARCGLVPAD